MSKAALEATVNMLVGLLINLVVLSLIFNISLPVSGSISLTMLGLSWLRSYSIRRVFQIIE